MILKAFDKFLLQGRVFFVVSNPIKTDDFSEIRAEPITIIDPTTGEGRLYRVTGVERFAHMPPFREGESIGVMVEEVVSAE